MSKEGEGEDITHSSAPEMKDINSQFVVPSGRVDNHMKDAPAGVELQISISSYVNKNQFIIYYI